MYTSTKFARARRGTEVKAKVLAIAMKRKEEYLGARVPKELKERVIVSAEELGIPVSILIRNILEEAFSRKGLKRGVINSRADTDIHKYGKGMPTTNKYPMVLGWEDIRLNRTTACTGCGKNLEPGSYVTLGIAGPGEERIIFCDLCKESL